MIFQKIHPLGSHRKIRKIGFGTPKESYEKLKPQGVVLLMKQTKTMNLLSLQALGRTQGKCIMAWGLGFYIFSI